MTYSVLEKPVIQVRLRNGEESDVSLRDAVLRAHEYEDVAGDNPLERYAVLRFLAAFVMDMLNMRTLADRRAVYLKGRFTQDEFDRYIGTCEKKGTSFDLFDPERPFMQAVFTQEERRAHPKGNKPMASIDLALPSGNAHTFRCKNGGVKKHVAENDFECVPAKAFRAMLARQCFCGYSLEGAKGINNLPLYVYPVGNNLFETILFHTLSKEEALPREYGEGTTAWRKDAREDPPDEFEIPQATYLEALTWQPRRIQLLADADGMVRKVYLKARCKFTGEYLDPNTIPNINGKTGEIYTLVPKITAPVWSNISSLLAPDETHPQPECIKGTLALFGANKPENVTLRFCGLSKDAMKYILYGWQEEEMELPESLLDDPAKARILRNDLRLLMDVTFAIPAEIKKDVRCMSIIDGAKRDIIFDLCMMDILTDTPEDKHKQNVLNEIQAMTDEVGKVFSNNNGESVREILESRKILRIMNKKIQAAIKNNEKEGTNNERGLDSEELGRDEDPQG